MQIREVLTILFLAFSSWKDWKQKEISLLLTVLYGAAGIGCSIYAGRNATDWMVPLGVSLTILAFSILTKGEIGLGDGWIFLALGTMLTMDIFVRTICFGMLGAALYAGILLVFFRKGRKTEIPLVPFLLVGYIGGLFL